MQTGQTYCIYNDSFLYLHIGFNSIDNSGIQSGTVIMTLPVKVSTVNANIGVIGMGTVQGYKAYIVHYPFHQMVMTLLLLGL